MQDITQQHSARSWWMRPLVWFIGAAVVLLFVFVMFEMTDGPAATSYGAFLDQLDAGNVASVTFQGTQIDGRFKQPVNVTASNKTTQTDTFRSHVPDFGDGSLIAELRKQHVAIDVTSPSAWTWLLGRVPWPMLVFIGAGLIAGLVRLVRGGKPGAGSPTSAQPMQGMMGLLSGFFGKQQDSSLPVPKSDEPKGV
jgi:ATP-dependent Zn protease